jgi:hypothetical protein
MRPVIGPATDGRRRASCSAGAWVGEQGGIILNPGADPGFSFDVWAETQVRLE